MISYLVWFGFDQTSKYPDQQRQIVHKPSLLSVLIYQVTLLAITIIHFHSVIYEQIPHCHSSQLSPPLRLLGIAYELTSPAANSPFVFDLKDQSTWHELNIIPNIISSSSRLFLMQPSTCLAVAQYLNTECHPHNTDTTDAPSMVTVVPCSSHMSQLQRFFSFCAELWFRMLRSFALPLKLCPWQLIGVCGLSCTIKATADMTVPKRSQLQLYMYTLILSGAIIRLFSTRAKQCEVLLHFTSNN